VKPFGFLKPLAYWLIRISPFFYTLAFHWPFIDLYPPYSMREMALYALMGGSAAAIFAGFLKTHWVTLLLGAVVTGVSILLMLKPMPNLADQLPMGYLWPATAGILWMAYGNSRE
jgi:hypothetical protein